MKAYDYVVNDFPLLFVIETQLNFGGRCGVSAVKKNLQQIRKNFGRLGNTRDNLGKLDFKLAHNHPQPRKNSLTLHCVARKIGAAWAFGALKSHLHFGARNKFPITFALAVRRLSGLSRGRCCWGRLGGEWIIGDNPAKTS